MSLSVSALPASAGEDKLSGMLPSMVCRYEHFLTPWYSKWGQALPLPHYGIDPSIPPTRPHRKAWEWAAITQALYERGKLEPGRSGCGFAVGAEPLPALFAAYGSGVLATDQAVTDEAVSWTSTGQHAASLEAIYRPEIIRRADFDARVRFRAVDMRALALPWAERFDYLWSSCSIEHLGNLEAGMAFVEHSTRLLKPGGCAVHTTEFNVGSDDETLASGTNVIYRRQDIERLDRRLRKIGCGLTYRDYNVGDHPYDLDFDIPPYGDPTRQHIKLLLEGHVATSFLLIVQKGNNVDRT